MYTITNTLNSTRSMILPNVRHKLGFFTGFSVSWDSTRFMSSSVPLSLLSVCCKLKIGKMARNENHLNFSRDEKLHLRAQSNVSSKEIVQIYCCQRRRSCFQSSSVLEPRTLTFHAQWPNWSWEMLLSEMSLGSNRLIIRIGKKKLIEINENSK